jgi:UDP-N-acetyl-D-glucosamine dehydrogenase
LDVIGMLTDLGAEVAYFDPHVPELEHENLGMKSVPDLLAAARDSDCVVVITDHDQIDYAALFETSPLIFDTRDAFRRAGIDDPKIVRL